MFNKTEFIILNPPIPGKSVVNIKVFQTRLNNFGRKFGFNIIKSQNSDCEIKTKYTFLYNQYDIL